MNKTKSKVLFGFHLVAFVLTAYFLWWGMFAAPCFEPEYLFQLTFLTQETLFFYYLWALKHDFDNAFAVSKKCKPYPEAAHTTLQILLPLTCLVTVGYWKMRLKDASLMVTDEGKGNPIILSLYNHGINIIFCLIETVCFNQKVVKGFKWKITLIVTTFILYVSTQFVFHEVTGRPVYPFLAALSLFNIAKFYAGLVAFLIVLERLNTFMILKIHGDGSTPKIAKETKSN